MTKTPKVGRNEACSCGSGKKFKHCCGANEGAMTLGGRLTLFALIGAVVAAIVFGVTSFTGERSMGPRQIWSAEHGHYHDVP